MCLSDRASTRKLATAKRSAAGAMSSANRLPSVRTDPITGNNLTNQSKKLTYRLEIN
jgi:hypothetical protein